MACRLNSGSLNSGGFWLAVNVLIFYQLEKNHSESDSDMVPLCVIIMVRTSLRPIHTKNNNYKDNYMCPQQGKG